MIDIEGLLRSVDLASLVAKTVKLEKNGKEWSGLCPFHNEKSPSFSVFAKSGKQRFHCFGCGSHGDAIDWVMKISGVDWNKAAELLGADKVPSGKIQQAPMAVEVSVYDEYEIAPTVEAGEFSPGVMTPRIFNPKRAGDPKREWGQFKPTLVHRYCDAGSLLLGYVLRHDLGEGRKETPLVRFVRRRDGEGEGFWSRFPFGRGQRPLYGLDRLAAAPAAPVLVVEGEKTADAMIGVLPYVPICWQGGAQAWSRSDWSPLAGRSVLLWPDADEPGLAAMYGIGALLEQIDNTSIRICHPIRQSLEAAA